jgi:hypothetical protein
MRQIITGAFWEELDRHILKAAIWCLGATLCWALISVGLYCFEGSNSYFEIKAVLLFKIILAAAIFLSRYLLFAKYRRQKWLTWFFGISFLIAFSTQGGCIVKNDFNWVYIVFKIGDSLAWGIFTAALLENIAGLFNFWRFPPKVSGSSFHRLCQIVRQDTIALGVLLTLLAGLFYYYLISFYLLDTLLYSYLLLALVLLAGIGFYIINRIQLGNWLQLDIDRLDREIDGFLQWQDFKADSELNQKMLWFEYLAAIRSYLIQMGRPGFPWQICGSYLLFSFFILALPYILGFAVEVGSFK